MSSGRGNRQIGQSPRWVLSGCWNKIFSCNSGARFWHDSSCAGLCSFWQSSLQYWTRSQVSHALKWVSSSSEMPHEVQLTILSSCCSSFELIVKLASLLPISFSWSWKRICFFFAFVYRPHPCCKRPPDKVNISTWKTGKLRRGKVASCYVSVSTHQIAAPIISKPKEWEERQE